MAKIKLKLEVPEDMAQELRDQHESVMPVADRDERPLKEWFADYIESNIARELMQAEERKLSRQPIQTAREQAQARKAEIQAQEDNAP